MMKLEERFFTAKEVAERLNLSTYAILGWLRSGYLKGHKYGRGWRVRESDFDAFVKNPPEMEIKDTEAHPGTP